MYALLGATGALLRILFATTLRLAYGIRLLGATDPRWFLTRLTLLSGIRCVVKYASPVWHTALLKCLSETTETVGPKECFCRTIYTWNSYADAIEKPMHQRYTKDEKMAAWIIEPR